MSTRGAHAVSAGGAALRSAALAGLTVAFTIALTYATLRLPDWIAGLVGDWIRIPGYDPAIETDDAGQLSSAGWRSWEAVNRWIETSHLELIGVACLLVVGLLIVAGLVARRRGLAMAGAVALFLPVFGSFAGSMFFLAGIGVLRVLWLPAWGTGLMALGDVAYLPYLVLVAPTWAAGADIRVWVAYAAVGIGLLIFTGATATWLRARFAGQSVAEGWLYRRSRHPQYLGWIVWSWGMTLYAALQPLPHGGENPGGALAWLLMTTVIICVAWFEEQQMLVRAGGTYAAYRRRTPFLLPLPRQLARALGWPLRRIVGDEVPARPPRLVLAALVYLALVMALSIPFAVLGWPPSGWWAWPVPI